MQNRNKKCPNPSYKQKPNYAKDRHFKPRKAQPEQKNDSVEDQRTMTSFTMFLFSYVANSQNENKNSNVKKP